MNFLEYFSEKNSDIFSFQHWRLRVYIKLVKTVWWEWYFYVERFHPKKLSGVEVKVEYLVKVWVWYADLEIFYGGEDCNDASNDDEVDVHINRSWKIIKAKVTSLAKWSVICFYVELKKNMVWRRELRISIW